MNIDRSEVSDDTFGSHANRLFALFLREFSLTSEMTTRVLREGAEPRPVQVITYRYMNDGVGKAHEVLLPPNYQPDDGQSWLQTPASQYPDTAFAKAYFQATSAQREAVTVVPEALQDCVAMIQRASRQVCDSPTTTLWFNLLRDMEQTGVFAMLSYATNYALKRQVEDAAQAGETLTVKLIAQNLQVSWSALFEDLHHIARLVVNNSSGSLRKEACANLMAPWLNRPEEANFRRALQSFVKLVGDFEGDGTRILMAVNYAYFTVHTLTIQEWDPMLTYVVQRGD